MIYKLSAINTFLTKLQFQNLVTQQVLTSEGNFH